MSKRRLFSLGSMDVTVHPAALAFAVYMILRGQGAFFLVAMASILLHEVAHALAAAALGELPTEIEWTPLGALLRLEDEQRLPPPRRFVMLLAGPLATLLLCAASFHLTRLSVLPRPAGRMCFSINLTLLVLNLLPCLPLDGGRMLSLALSLFLRPETVARVMRWTGSLLGAAFLLGSMVLTWLVGGWNLSMASCGCFLLYAACTGTLTEAMAELRQLMTRKIALEKRGFLPEATLAAVTTTPLRRIIRALPAKRCAGLLLLEPGTLRPLMRCGEAQLIAAYLDTPGESCGVLLNNASEAEKT